MKVLQIAKYYPPVPGGIESFVRDLSHELVAEGHDNLVLAHKRSKGEPDEISGSAGRVVRVPSYGELMHAPIAPGYFTRLRNLLSAFKPDMIVVHMPNVSGFWPLFMSLPCPMIVYWHADVIFPSEKYLHRFAYLGYSRLERTLLKRASRIIATSPPYLASSRPLQPFQDKCEVVPLGIDTDRILQVSEEDVAAVKTKIMGNANAQYVYSAGRFSHYKGFENLIQAAATIRVSRPNLKYVIAGDGETRTEMLRLVKDYGLEETIFLPGHVTDQDYWALMKGCHMFCLPSTERTEAFGIVLLEAMVMGKPCISTDIPGSGTGWVNRHGETGLVVRPNDVRALAQAISTLLSKSETALAGADSIQLSIKEITQLVLNIGKEAGNTR